MVVTCSRHRECTNQQPASKPKPWVKRAGNDGVVQQGPAEHSGRRLRTLAGSQATKKAKPTIAELLKPTGRLAMLTKEIDAKEKKAAQMEQQDPRRRTPTNGEDEPVFGGGRRGRSGGRDRQARNHQGGSSRHRGLAWGSGR
eukprot:15442513-Alexandrium_andersonii.AAC.1